MSIIGTNGETTVDELTSSGALNISKFEVRRVLDRGVAHGFVIKHGRKYSRSDYYYTDAAKRKRKQSKGTKKYKKAKKSEKAERRFKRKSLDTPEKAQRSESDIEEERAEREIYARRTRHIRGEMRRIDREAIPKGKATVMRKIDRRAIREYQPRQIDYSEEMSDE